MEIKLDKKVTPAYYSKFKPQILKRILADIKKGSPNKIAAEANGVAESTFYDWIRQGIFDLQHDVESEHAALAVSVRAIEQDEIQELRIKAKASDKGHRGAEWTLERAYWRHYSAKIADLEFDERLKKLEESQNGS